MKKKLGSSRLCVIALACFTIVWSVLSVWQMLSYRERGDFGYTGATDYTVRMCLIVACAILFILAMIRLILAGWKGTKEEKAVTGAYSLLSLAGLLAVVISGISLYREFQNSARLLEDTMFLLLTFAATVTVLIGSAAAGRARIISGAVATGFLFIAVALGFLLFRENTYRSLNFMYYAHRIGYLFPFATATFAAALLPRRGD